MSKAKKTFWIALGFIAMGLGCAGIFLPVVPTTSPLLLASYCFAKGSERFHSWFTSTKIYKKYLEPFEKTRALTLRSKLAILLPVTAIILLSAYLIKNWYVRVFMILLLAFKYYYFKYKIKTISPEKVLNEVTIKESV